MKGQISKISKIAVLLLLALVILPASACDFPVSANAQLWPAGIKAGIGDGIPKDTTPYVSPQGPT